MEIVDLQAKKDRGEPLVVLTCSDAPTARWQEAAGVDIVFCADSLGTNLLGYDSEQEVTMDDMVHHLKAVRRGLSGAGAYLLADLPYGTCDTVEDARANARRFVDAGAQGVKLEGFKPDIVAALRADGIDVCGHLGLNPQIHAKKRIQARTAAAAGQLLRECVALQEAGAQLLVLEAIPDVVAAEASRRLRIPTIGIAAGADTDGQVLVVTDLLGVHDLHMRHVRRYAQLHEVIPAAVRGYVEDVRGRRFPTAEQTWQMAADEARAFAAWVAAHPA